TYFLFHKSFNEDFVEYKVFLNAGDRVGIGFGGSEISAVRITDSEFYVEEAGSPVDFGKALINYPVKDFIKEMMIRHALTAFPDPENKFVDFMTMDERVSAPAKNWSS